MKIERYYVMHIVSNGGELVLVNSLGFIQSLLPGTVSGAPKIRAMEIIHELEHRRGPYSGAITILKANWIAITIQQCVASNNTVSVRRWSVADSDPEKEYEETLARVF